MSGVLDKAIDSLSCLFHDDFAAEWSKLLNAVSGMQGASKFFKGIASVKNQEQAWDYLAEARFALVFKGAGCEVAVCGEGQPDLWIHFGALSAFVEVTRRRENAFTARLALPRQAVSTNMSGDIRRVHDKLGQKLRQVAKANAECILALWSDTDTIRKDEVRGGVAELRRTPPGPSKNLALVVFGSKWVRCTTDQQLYCIPVREPLGPKYEELIRQLERATVDALVLRALGDRGSEGRPGAQDKDRAR